MIVTWEHVNDSAALSLVLAMVLFFVVFPFVKCRVDQHFRQKEREALEALAAFLFLVAQTEYDRMEQYALRLEEELRQAEEDAEFGLGS